ncbi:MAG TPA: hypothetical protein DHV17_02900 [Chitinophagaceae bacterium]|nr:hypothetical protein [Chitinophagaceae bacterium]
MRFISNIRQKGLLMGISAMLVMSACNKDLETFDTTPTPAPTGLSLAEAISPANTDDSLYYHVVVRAGLLPTFSNRTAQFTMFVPTNQAIRILINAASGGLVPVNAPDPVFVGFIQTSLPVATANGIVSYNTCPQVLRSGSIPSTFPNFQYPSILNPAPSVSALLRLTTFPSTANGAWLNNVPLAAVNQDVANGVIHKTAFVVTPPQRYLWDRINTDPDLTYLRAAILRADSGATSSTSLQGFLQNIGANFTVFAPTNAAFQTTITGAIFQALVSQGVDPSIALPTAQALASTPDVFTNPLVIPYLPAQSVRGIVVYHVLGTRAFTNNIPTADTNVPTLLNSAVPVHPGLTIKANFGVPFVSSATVKGLANATAANIIINSSPLLPDPVGTSDQHYLNGTLHKIDQVLMPQ